LQSELSEQSLSLQQSKPTKNVRRKEPLLEGGNNLQKTERKLQRSDLSEMPERVSINGKKRRVHNATPSSDGSTSQSSINKNRSSTSRRPQSKQQQNRESCAFCKQYFAQAIRTLGFGTALKPSCEPITVARKPFKGSVAENVLKHGTGGINIDGSRVGTETIKQNQVDFKNAHGNNLGAGTKQPFKKEIKTTEGRFPANLIHDGSDEIEERFPNIKQPSFREGNRVSNNDGIVPWNKGRSSREEVRGAGYFDTGSASRFFYTAKCSKEDRNYGLGEFEEQERVRQGLAGEKKDTKSANTHPTVKPVDLMRYLVKLVTPKDGVCLDPYIGSGTTAIACKMEKFNYIGIDREEEYCKIAEARIKAWIRQEVLF